MTAVEDKAHAIVDSVRAAFAAGSLHRNKAGAPLLTEVAILQCLRDEGSFTVQPFDRGCCETCGGQSGGTHVGVASVPGNAYSATWCTECLQRNTAPAWIFDHDFVFVAGGDLAALADWARARETWADGRYVPFDEYVQRITPERIAQEMKEFEDAMVGARVTS